MNSDETDYCVMMQILKPHGIHGCVKAISYADDPYVMANQEVCLLENNHSAEQWVKINRVFGVVQNKCILSLVDIDNPEKAASLRFRFVAIPRSQLPQIADSEHYWTDIIGYRVDDTAGKCHGEIKSVGRQLGGDVAFVAIADEPPQCILLVKDWIAKIDKSERVVIVNKEFWEGQ